MANKKQAQHIKGMKIGALNLLLAGNRKPKDYQVLHYIDIGNELYIHGINTKDDSIFLMNIDGEILATVLHDGYMLIHPNKDYFGKFRLNECHSWYFEFLTTKRERISFGMNSLIKFEAVVFEILLKESVLK